MASQKLYIGTKLREIRHRFGLMQKDFATRLGISIPYLNQMENNNRPVSASVILALAHEFSYDVSELSVDEADRMVADMREALADPLYSDTPNLQDLKLVASNAPLFAKAFLDLHQAYKQSRDKLISINDSLGQEATDIAPLPWEEVRDFFHYCDNYLDAIDKTAERFGEKLALEGDKLEALSQWFNDQHNITVKTEASGILRHFQDKTLTLNAHSERSTRLFQALNQLALIEHEELLEATLDLARFRSDEARQICKVGLANYFAGAAAMPYQSFLLKAHEFRHDLELLAQHFQTSIEQTAQRLSTLQRPGAKGIPFYFVRVDQAGTITKRHSATHLQFARFSGSCPLWNVHKAFETPNQFLRQLAVTPDHRRYFCLARAIFKSGGAFSAPTRRYAIGLGCEISEAHALVYADDFDLNNEKAFEPIGISCRICPRKSCFQRAVPPLEQKIKISSNSRDLVPYKIE